MTMAAATVRTGAVVGIEELLDPSGPPVRGTVKARPQDFEVREISAERQVVGFSDHKDRVPTLQEKEAVLQKLVEAKAASNAAVREKMVFVEPSEGWRIEMDTLVGQQDAALVEAVAMRKAEEHVLPAPKEFKDRVYLQVCIQHCFPGLDCKLLKNQESDTEMEVRVQVVLDPVYRKLHDGGMVESNCNALMKFLRAGANDPAASKGLELEHDDSKEARTTLHRVISKNTSCFKTTTENRRGVQRVVAYFTPKNNKKRKRSQPDVLVRFVLCKTNFEHFSCFERLRRELNCPLSAFSFAGTKDKTAVTFQHVVVRGARPEQLLQLNGATADSDTGFEIGDLEYVGAPMSLGSAKGNRFTIAIRDLESDAPDLLLRLTETIRRVETQGFINYFGFQRVGNPSSAIRPHHIGEKIVAEQWKDVVVMLLTVDDRDHADVKTAKRAYLENGDVDGALKLLPLHLTMERLLLQGLKRHGADAFEQAVNNVPHSRRLLYLHAYQSYLFNRAASSRVRSGGLRAIEGDLVQDGTGEAVRAITAEEAATMNELSATPLSTVVLPLAGTNVLLPANAAGTELLEIATQHGTKAALFESGPLKGAYRPLLALPTDVNWSLDEATKTAELSFTLGSGSFATMCLREVLKIDL